MFCEDIYRAGIKNFLLYIVMDQCFCHFIIFIDISASLSVPSLRYF